MTYPATPPRQYGGHTPPPGYMQFLVEHVPEWYKDTRYIAHLDFPFMLWADPVSVESLCPKHGNGWPVSVQSFTDLFPGFSYRGHTICPCYGRFIE